MKRRPGPVRNARRMLCAAVAFAWLWGAPAIAQERWAAAELLKPDLLPLSNEPVSLLQTNGDGGLSFDLGDSHRQKLQLRLAEPLLLPAQLTPGGSGIITGAFAADSTLNWRANDKFSLELNAAQAQLGSPFKPLGSIHCENGVLAPDSYTASGCYFVDQAGVSELNSLSLGARYALGDTASAAFNVFRKRSETAVEQGVAASALGLTGDDLGRAMAGQTFDPLGSEVTGIDLEFRVGVSTDRAGDMRLGLQLTRVLDASAERLFPEPTGLGRWILDGPSDSARVSFDWQKGAFSGGVQSYYRAPVAFMNRNEMDSLTTFDVHFTWRTPWNANLSVGASNVLNAGTEDGNVQENLSDPFESVYGRIPYVRYQQDL